MAKSSIDIAESLAPRRSSNCAASGGGCIGRRLGKTNIVLPGNTISGQVNRNGNDGTVSRFGWKAQNKSLLMFAGEAYNVEMGISNELFQTEREENPACQFATTPNDTSNPQLTGLSVS